MRLHVPAHLFSRGSAPGCARDAVTGIGYGLMRACRVSPPR